LEREPLLYPDMPLDATLRHFARWPVLLIRNGAQVTAMERILTEARCWDAFAMRSRGAIAGNSLDFLSNLREPGFSCAMALPDVEFGGTLQ
jgi:hypothetical protein